MKNNTKYEKIYVNISFPKEFKEDFKNVFKIVMHELYCNEIPFKIMNCIFIFLISRKDYYKKT